MTEIKDKIVKLRKVKETPIRMWIQVLVEFSIDGEEPRILKHQCYPAANSGIKYAKRKKDKKVKKTEINISEGGELF